MICLVILFIGCWGELNKSHPNMLFLFSVTLPTGVLVSLLGFIVVNNKVRNAITTINDYSKALQMATEGKEVVGWWIGRIPGRNVGYRSFSGTWIWPWKGRIFYLAKGYFQEKREYDAITVFADITIVLTRPDQASPKTLPFVCNTVHEMLEDAMDNFSPEKEFEEFLHRLERYAEEKDVLSIEFRFWRSDTASKTYLFPSSK